MPRRMGIGDLIFWRNLRRRKIRTIGNHAGIFYRRPDGNRKIRTRSPCGARSWRENCQCRTCFKFIAVSIHAALPKSLRPRAKSSVCLWPAAAGETHALLFRHTVRNQLLQPSTRRVAKHRSTVDSWSRFCVQSTIIARGWRDLRRQTSGNRSC